MSRDDLDYKIWGNELYLHIFQARARFDLAVTTSRNFSRWGPWLGIVSASTSSDFSVFGEMSSSPSTPNIANSPGRVRSHIVLGLLRERVAYGDPQIPRFEEKTGPGFCHKSFPKLPLGYIYGLRIQASEGSQFAGKPNESGGDWMPSAPGQISKRGPTSLTLGQPQDSYIFKPPRIPVSTTPQA
ncbi:hypothetical protein DL98DRAFT_595187 [Cadophora sp. DSE1049]|nr:hypothetical protein DL98DRAFT_595187 [Cadophora sp. DSE1049]